MMSIRALSRSGLGEVADDDGITGVDEVERGVVASDLR